MERIVDINKPVEVRIFAAKDPQMNHDWRDADLVTPSLVQVRTDDGKIEKWVKSFTGEIWYEGQKVGEVRNKGAKDVPSDVPDSLSSTREAFKEVNRRLCRLEKYLHELSLELNKRGQR